jgi:hypothetical protein
MQFVRRLVANVVDRGRMNPLNRRKPRERSGVFLSLLSPLPPVQDSSHVPTLPGLPFFAFRKAVERTDSLRASLGYIPVGEVGRFARIWHAQELACIQEAGFFRVRLPFGTARDTIAANLVAYCEGPDA